MNEDQEQPTTGELRVIQSLEVLSHQIDRMVRTDEDERGEARGAIETFRVDQGVFREDLRALETAYQALDRALRGDAEGKQPGLLLRLDRLEQFAANIVWRERAMWGVIVGLIGKVLLDIIIK